VADPHSGTRSVRVAYGRLESAWLAVLTFLSRSSRVAAREALRVLRRRGALLAAAEFVDRFGDPGCAHVDQILQVRRVLESGVPAQPDPETTLREPNGRVLLALHQSMPQRQNGYAIRSHQILRSLRGHGIDAVAVTRPGFPQDLGLPIRPGTEREEVDGVTYRRLAPGPNGFETSADHLYIADYADALARLIDELDCSVVHGASNFMNARAAVVAGRKTGARSLYEVRGLWHLTRQMKSPVLRGSDEMRYKEQMEFDTMCSADSVVVISEALARYVRDRGVAADRLTVIPNCVDPELFEPVPRDEALARELGVEDQFVIGFLGSLEPYEGVDVLVDATEMLLREHANAVLLGVGDGSARADLEAQVRSRQLGGSVRFLGRVPFTEVQRYYSLFDVCPFPRTSHEVTRLVPPLKILEAMAMEKPVIVSDLDPLLEIAQPGVTGRSARADDARSLCEALRASYEDPAERDAMAKSAREWVVRERSWSKVSERFLPLYGPESRP
jgi:glycosyltransferase involved in cell wall biosynthesis